MLHLKKMNQMNYKKTFIGISTNWLTKDLINRFRILNGAKYFSLGRFQNYLVVIPAKKYFKCFNGTTKSDSNFALTFVIYHLLPNINFNRHCLINNISVPKKK